jgi:radical SAM superfamily enzyme YgiQ (UPF0313 family)
MLAQEIHALLPDMPIIFGGYFASSACRILLKRYPFITAVVLGDGEAAALEISRSLAQGRSFLSDQTPNLAWREGDEIRATPVRPMSLDALPILNFNLWRAPSCHPLIEIMTSRGCPYDCTYCLESSMRPYAKYPAAWVTQQLDHLEPIASNDWLLVFDPIFGLGQRQTLETCEALRGRRFNYAVESRVDVLSPDLIPALRAAGIEGIYFGFESASPTTLLRMRKVRSADKAHEYADRAKQVLKACFENDVTPIVGFMLAFPGDTEADYQASLTFAQDLKQLHDQVAAQTGFQSGYVFVVSYTQVYEETPLEKQIKQEFPDVVLEQDSFIGGQTVLSPSPSVDMDMTCYYENEIQRYDAYTPVATDRSQRYILFPMLDFVQAHPELTDEEGVIALGDGLQRFPEGFLAVKNKSQLGV